MGSSPVQAQALGTIVFGTGFRVTTQPFVIQHQKGTFSGRAGGKMAWVVQTNQQVNASSIKLAISRQYAGGVEAPVFSTTSQVSDPRYSSFANKVAVRTMFEIVGYKYGTYSMRVWRQNTVLAHGSFRLVR